MIEEGLDRYIVESNSYLGQHIIFDDSLTLAIATNPIKDTTMSTMTEPRKVHEGRSLKRIREILGVKQETLAIDLGISQQAISSLEQRETIEPDLLKQVAGILKVPVEAIQNFSEEAAIFSIQTMNDNSQAIYQYNLNPVDKWLEALEENKRLYERLLQAEKEKFDILQQLTKK